ncbi:BOI-related E3 ubiquitin-protein ligase 1-like protein [Tanacetum coccineum]
MDTRNQCNLWHKGQKDSAKLLLGATLFKFKDATTNTAECIHKGKSMFPVFVPIMLLESKSDDFLPMFTLMQLSKLPNKYQKDALRTLLFGNSSLCTLYTLFIINILINPMPINVQHKLECLPYFMYVCLSCLMHSQTLTSFWNCEDQHGRKLALKVFMALMNSDADVCHMRSNKTVISALQSVLQEDFKANEIEQKGCLAAAKTVSKHPCCSRNGVWPRTNRGGIRNGGGRGMPNMRANVRRGRKFGFEKSVDELEKELEDYLFVDKQPREFEANLMQKKVQISLNQNYYNEESDRPSSMPNPHDVSTGLKLSYDDEERLKRNEC